jgi:predicted dehydrogenase
LRILIVGLGSMGKRRIRNLLKLGQSDIIGFDTRKDRRNETTKKYHIKTFSRLDEAFEKKPGLMIISTPPDLHLKYAKVAIEKNVNFFTELNMFSKDIEQIIHKMRGKSIVGLPSCTLRFHPVVKKAKQLLDKNTIGNVLLIQQHIGQYLPNWHPWEDYRKFFVSKRETGGARELLPFELFWLTYLFSDIKSVYANIGKVSKLDADIDDFYQILIEFKNKIFCTLNIDVVSIPSFRETKIIGEKGTILCNFVEGTIKINRGKNWKELKLNMGSVAKGYVGSTPPEALYEDEMRAVLNAIKKEKKYPYSMNDELKTLKTMDIIEQSSKKGKK